MKLLDDLTAFLEQRLDEFLRANPGLELQILLMEVEQQEAQTQQLLLSLQSQRQQAEQDILGLVDEVRKWHDRIIKAEQANRPDLAQAAQAKEQELRQKGNLLWQQMDMSQRQTPATQALLAKIQARRQEISTRLQQTQTTSKTPETRWSSVGTAYERPLSSPTDPLDAQFREMELKAALEELKQTLS